MQRGARELGEQIVQRLLPLFSSLKNLQTKYHRLHELQVEMLSDRVQALEEIIKTLKTPENQNK